jgi:hypothetical protein
VLFPNILGGREQVLNDRHDKQAEQWKVQKQDKRYCLNVYGFYPLKRNYATLYNTAMWLNVVIVTLDKLSGFFCFLYSSRKHKKNTSYINASCVISADSNRDASSVAYKCTYINT